MVAAAVPRMPAADTFELNAATRSALGEALREIFDANPLFIQPSQNELGTIAFRAQICVDRFRMICLWPGRPRSFLDIGNIHRERAFGALMSGVDFHCFGD